MSRAWPHSLGNQTSLQWCPGGGTFKRTCSDSHMPPGCRTPGPELLALSGFGPPHQDHRGPAAGGQTAAAMEKDVPPETGDLGRLDKYVLVNTLQLMQSH